MKVNNIVRRAKQYRDLVVKVQALPIRDIVLVGHSDSSLLNMGEGKTQAGWVLGISSKALLEKEEGPWAPFLWRSYKLRRTVGSSMAAEAQVFLDAAGTMEWTLSFLLELWQPGFCLEERHRWMARIRTLLVTDAKDVYDHIIAANPSAGLKDLRAGADLIIIKEALERTSTTPRWAPDVLGYRGT